MRVGLAGYGLAGAVFHAPLIATTPGLSLVGVLTRNPERIAQAAHDHPEVVVVASIDELLHLDLDLLVVATTNSTHVPLARAGIEAGVAVVVDKPLAPSAAEARDLVEAAAGAGVPFSTFQNRRWDGDFLTVKSLVRAGGLGTIRRLESRFERWRPALSGGWRERADPGEAGGLLFDLGSHLVDQALILLGPVDSVYAEIDRRRSERAADDDVFVALQHTSGARSHLWASAVAASLGPRFRVLGSSAAYVCDGLDGQEAALRSGARPGPGWGRVGSDSWGQLVAGDEHQAVPTLPGDYPAYYVGMAAALRDGAPVPVEATDSVRGLEILEAAARSAVERRVVAV